MPGWLGNTPSQDIPRELHRRLYTPVRPLPPRTSMGPAVDQQECDDIFRRRRELTERMHTGKAGDRLRLSQVVWRPHQGTFEPPGVTLLSPRRNPHYEEEETDLIAEFRQTASLAQRLKRFNKTIDTEFDELDEFCHTASSPEFWQPWRRPPSPISDYGYDEDLEITRRPATVTGAGETRDLDNMGPSWICPKCSTNNAIHDKVCMVCGNKQVLLQERRPRTAPGMGRRESEEAREKAKELFSGDSWLRGGPRDSLLQKVKDNRQEGTESLHDLYHRQFGKRLEPLDIKKLKRRRKMTASAPTSPS